MNNENKLIKIITPIFAFLPLISYILLYTSLPDQLPMNISLDGTVNSYGSKLEFLILPAITVVMYFVMKIVPKIDPKGKAYEKVAGFYSVFILFMTIFLGIVYLSMLCIVWEIQWLDVNFVIFILLGFLFLLIGNYMPRMKQNFTMGIKTPWTLSSEKVWNKTHRLSGYLFVLSSLPMFLMAFFNGTIMFVLMSIVIAVAVIVPTVMSYVWYKEETKNSSEI
ncbi:MAG: SdpI family protein [Clostridia bacterium]